MKARTCGRCSSPLELEDLRCAVCALPTPVLSVDERPSESVAQILRCNGCGAGVQYSAEARAPRCDFCGAVMELETPEDPIEQAERYLDFTVSEAQARQALKQWLGRKSFFRPSDLQTTAAVDGLKPLWWAGWMFDAAASVCWAADSNLGSRSSAWAPHSGEFTMEAQNVVVPASVGLSAAECRALVSRYDLRRCSDKPQGHPGASVEQFTLQRSAARKVISEALEGVARTRATPKIPGSRTRKLRVSVLPSRLSTSHVAFPAFVFAYRYRDKLYRAVVHGQDPSCVLGKPPRSWTKLLLVIAAVVAAVALVMALVSAM